MNPLTRRVVGLLALLLLIASPAATPVTSAAAQDVAAPPTITARGAVLWDPADERVLHGVQEDVARPMASTTKIMTVLLAIEAEAIDDQLTVSAGAATQGGASLGLLAGQVIPVRSIVAGLMLRSGNDAAVALAEHIADSESAFVARMNARAAELGLEQTQFVNPSGLTDDPSHRASPLDLARLSQVAMAHPDFAYYAGAPEVTVPGLPPMVSRNELLGRYPGATGIKTGFTTLAGLTLVASAERDGRLLYAVVLGSEDSFSDAAALLDYGFAAFRRPVVFADGANVMPYRWARSEVDVVAAETLTATVPVAAAVRWRATLEPQVELPVDAGAILGTVELLVEGEPVDSVELRAAAPAPAPPAATGPVAAGAAVQDAVRAFLRLQPVERAA